MKELVCHNCGHKWKYVGKRTYYTNCPTCRFNVNIKKSSINVKKILELEGKLSTGSSSSPSAVEGVTIE